jgi:hypothetical protein
VLRSKQHLIHLCFFSHDICDLDVSFFYRVAVVTGGNRGIGLDRWRYAGNSLPMESRWY